MNRRSRTYHRRQAAEGQVLVLFALSSIVLLGIMALAVDVGFLLAERRQVQAAADAGALAAAHSFLLNDGDMITSGKEYGSDNAGVSVNDVDVNRPPTGGEHAGDDAYVEVVITKDVERYFLGAVYSGDWVVMARAVAVVEPNGVNAALLALNSDEGGISTSGSSYIETINGSVVSNYNIKTSGSTVIKADEHINANDGYDFSGSTTIDADEGDNAHAAEVPDPLLTLIQPPDLPAFAGNPVPEVTPSNEECYTVPTWYQASGSYEYTGRPGRFNSGGASCVTIEGVAGGTFTFPDGDYSFGNNVGVKLNSYPEVLIDEGVWNFTGSQGGINVTGSTNSFEMRDGEYAFLDGADISIGGSSPGNVLGGTFYFEGENNKGGLDIGGSNVVTLNPGTFIFDDGPGFRMSGSSNLHLAAGDYEFWFLEGADLRFSGSSYISADPGAYVKMYFYGEEGNFSNLDMTGSTNMTMPSGEYYFDRGAFLASGSSEIHGDEIFLYFKNGGHLSSNGSAKFGFQAPTDVIYPGYFPGVFIYSDRDNTATFEWTGSTSSVSTGIVYLPSSKVKMSGSSTSKAFKGQFIADSFETGGSNGTVIEFYEYVETAIPTVYLVD